MDPNPFIRALHLKKADEQWHNKYTESWEKYKKRREEIVWSGGGLGDGRSWSVSVVRRTEQGFVSYRSQIKQGIESAKQPTVGKTF
jgi:hypothetical protein